MPSIIQLRSEGCTLIQIQEWLKSEGVTVSHVALSKRLKRTQGPSANPTPNIEMKGEEKKEEKLQPTTPPASTTRPGSYLTREEREAIADKYVSNTDNNPVIRRILEKQAKEKP